MQVLLSELLFCIFNKFKIKTGSSRHISLET
jgi:hypothetical protein